MALPEPRTIVLQLGGPISRADVPALCAQLCAHLGALAARERAQQILCDVGLLDPDAVTVEALARLGLTARRLGCGLRLRSVSRELQELLAFTGLDGVLLRLEAVRQTEEREERLGVEEERELGDPPV